MFVPGNIIYFDPFYFKNGNTAKPKYFVVLKNINNLTVIASLPTRTDSIPAHFEINNNHQCINNSQNFFNCYVIKENIPITICGKSFDFQTHLYGEQIDDYEISILSEIYPNQGIDYHIWGELIPEIFQNIIDCFRNSSTIKRKYKRLL